MERLTDQKLSEQLQQLWRMLSPAAAEMLRLRWEACKFLQIRVRAAAGVGDKAGLSPSPSLSPLWLRNKSLGLSGLAQAPGHKTRMDVLLLSWPGLNIDHVWTEVKTSQSPRVLSSGQGSPKYPGKWRAPGHRLGRGTCLECSTVDPTPPSPSSPVPLPRPWQLRRWSCGAEAPGPGQEGGCANADGLRQPRAAAVPVWAFQVHTDRFPPPHSQGASRGGAGASPASACLGCRYV
jgi:hypothetical protein